MSTRSHCRPTGRHVHGPTLIDKLLAVLGALNGSTARILIGRATVGVTGSASGTAASAVNGQINIVGALGIAAVGSLGGLIGGGVVLVIGSTARLYASGPWL